MAEDAWFAPSDAAELEGVLDQEEAIGSPADMFVVEEIGDDPMASIFASKQAASNDGIVKPGDLVSHFEADKGSEGRDADTDHDGDLLTEIANLHKPAGNEWKRDKQDTTNELKEPKDKQAGTKARRVAGKKVDGGGAFPKLATHFDPLAQAVKIAGGNLAALVFSDEADYQ
jgi:hypothetical protein